MTSSPRDHPRPPSLLGSVVPVTLFVLLAGIVGPIFLVMGLNVDGPETGWLLPTGIGITALDLVIGVLVGMGRHRGRLKTYRLKQRGRKARGEVLSFEQTNVRINDQPLVRLRLRISGADIAPFEVEGKHVVSEIRLPLLYAGELPVLVDPETKEWEIDWDSARPIAPASSSYSPPVPSAAAVADTRTAGERLAELDELLRADLISRDEYDVTRARILDEL